MSPRQTKAAIEIAFTALGVSTGAVTPVEGARRVMASLPDLIPVEDLKEFLSDQDRIFAELSADVAEQIKLSGLKP
ncbi:MAG: hypothetical protein H0U66_02020 [Gemmatimonadaceae bacterium]|nr:hypothetical protein [Gemmatimonadaceae bacterium]